MREVRVLQLAKHVNIVNLLEAYRSQSGRLYLVFGGWGARTGSEPHACCWPCPRQGFELVVEFGLRS